MTTSNPARDELSWMLRRARSRPVRSMRDFAFTEIVVPKGRYRSTRLRPEVQPYVCLLLEAIDSGRWTRTSVVGCVQSGKSTAGFVLPAMYYVFEHRDDTVVFAPTMGVCRDKWSKEICPAIQASRYANLLPTDGAGSRGGWAEEITFLNGASLKFMSGGGGDEKRSSYTGRAAVCTEVDKSDKAGGSSRETDPIRQVENRLASWPEPERRVHLECTVSVPKGRIWQEYLRGTQSRIACPCPHCGDYVTPERPHLVGWQQAESESEARELAHFCCPGCGHALTEQDRRAMNLHGSLVHRGQTIDRDGQVHGEPPETNTLGFRWNCFNNMFWTAAEIGAKEWLAVRAVDEESAEKELCQFVWVIPYEPPAMDLAPLDEAILRRRVDRQLRRGQLPEDTQYVVCHVDVHQRLLYWMAIAWQPEARGVLTAYGRREVPSDDLGLERGIAVALLDFRDWVLEGWPLPDGSVRVPDQVWVDAGWQADTVYDFCRPLGPRFRPAKGYGFGQRAGSHYSAPKKVGGQIRWIGEEYHVAWLPDKRILCVEVDANHWKAWGRARLATPAIDQHTGKPVPGAVVFYAGDSTNEHTTLVKQLTAERPAVEFVENKGDKLVWHRESRANHYLDNFYNCCAAGHLCGVRLLPRRSPRPTATTNPSVLGGVPVRGGAYMLTDRV